MIELLILKRLYNNTRYVITSTHSHISTGFQKLEKLNIKNCNLSFQAVVEVLCNYPLDYPNVLPSVFVRCNEMSRISQKQFNDNLQSYMSTLETGELCMGSGIMWIQENVSQWIEDGKDSDNTPGTCSPKAKCKYTGLSRLWI